MDIGVLMNSRFTPSAPCKAAYNAVRRVFFLIRWSFGAFFGALVHPRLEDLLKNLTTAVLILKLAWGIWKLSRAWSREWCRGLKDLRTISIFRYSQIRHADVFTVFSTFTGKQGAAVFHLLFPHPVIVAQPQFTYSSFAALAASMWSCLFAAIVRAESVGTFKRKFN